MDFNMLMSKIYVVVPNLNGEDYLQECLDSLQEQTIYHQIVVVDNGSTDESLSILDSYEDIIVISKETNTGFTGGVNTGIEYALSREADAVALFNNDAVAAKDWLEKLAKGLGEEVAGISTSKILLEDRKHLDSTGDFVTIWGVPFPRGRHEVDSGQYDDNQDVFGASGGASLYRAEMLEEIGLFDDDFFAYLEDVDISFRAQAAGWKVKYAPQAKVYHKLSATSSKLGKDFAFYHFVKNFILLYTRNMPTKLLIKYSPLFIIHLARLGVGSLLRGQIATFIKSVWATVKLTPQTLSKRKHRQSLRVLSANEIDNKLYRGLPPRPPALQDDD